MHSITEFFCFHDQDKYPGYPVDESIDTANAECADVAHHPGQAHH